jgi:hypothetical protein
MRESLVSIVDGYSQVRSAAIDALIQLMNLSGGIEERIWNLIDAKKRKAVHRHAAWSAFATPYFGLLDRLAFWQQSYTYHIICETQILVTKANHNLKLCEYIELHQYAALCLCL